MSINYSKFLKNGSNFRKFIGILYSLAFCALLLLGCDDGRKNDDTIAGVIKFATCADYPPFEYYKDGKLTGFDVELGELLAQKLGRKVVFEDMAFGSILVSVQDGVLDAAISAVEPSEEKAKVVDFTNVYCRAGVALVYRKRTSTTSLSQLGRRRVAYQNGCSIHSKLLKDNAPDAELIIMDKMNVAIESLKAGHVDYVVMDKIPAKEFCRQNEQLNCSVVSEGDDGYVIMLKKGSTLKAQLDNALQELEADGELQRLREKWL
ncbi:MAG: ABC transporter substrate-binding protein [Holosporaceae bacterium]|jgi:polar amino acid transport system substrate-binding protein|nr:ABC transporter substrate-binding protein [Holosporaceae bacterium]